MKIYFAASIQKSKKPQIKLYKKIVQYLSNYGTVLTNKIGDENFYRQRRKKALSLREINQIYKFDLKLLSKADMMVAEVSTPSLGVGYEIGRMVKEGKPVLCLCNEKKLNELSTIIRGSFEVTLKTYKNFPDIELIIGRYFKILLKSSFDK